MKRERQMKNTQKKKIIRSYHLPTKNCLRVTALTVLRTLQTRFPTPLRHNVTMTSMAADDIFQIQLQLADGNFEKIMRELFDRLNTIALICYVALVSFRHSKQTEIVMVHKKKKFYNDGGKYKILHVTFLRFCSNKNILL